MTKTADVVAGNQIQVAWGNEIRDRTTQIVASTAERDSSFPTPFKGQTIYVASNDGQEGFYIWNGFRWTRQWNGPLGLQYGQISFGSVAGPFTTQYNTIGGNMIWSSLTGRVYQMQYQLQARSDNMALGELANIAITDGSDTVLYEAQHFVGSGANWTNIYNQFNASSSALQGGGAGTQLTWKWKVGRFAGTGNFYFRATLTSPWYFHINDTGPSGAPS